MQNRLVIPALILLCAVCIQPCLAQEKPQAKDEELIQLGLPDPVELKVLVDFVAQRMDMNILHDDQIRGQRVSLKARAPVPASSLPGLLESTLMLKGFALVDAEQPGWKKIVKLRNFAEVAEAPKQEEDGREVAPTRVVTQVFELKHAPLQQVEQLVRPFLTPNGGSSFSVPEQNQLIAIDLAANMQRIKTLIEAIDRAPREDPTSTRLIRIANMSAGDLANQLTKILALQDKNRPNAANGGGPSVQVLPIERTNQVMLVGSPESVLSTVELLEELDVPLGLETRMYTFQSASADRIDSLAKQLIGDADAKRLYQSAIDKDSNTLIVTATAGIHERVATLKKDFDQVVAAENNPIRFYQLKNAVAADVLETMLSISGEAATRRSETSAHPIPQTNIPANQTTDGSSKNRRDAAVSGSGNEATNIADAPNLSVVLESGVRLMSDTGTNSIIVVGPPDVQRVYEQLMAKLDKRRPQVLLEVTVVTLDTSGGYSFGVDVSRNSEVDGDPLLTFGSFGLSEVDPDTGRLTLSPGLGFNGALLSADVADIIVRALKTNGRARVLSAPKILVSDHATGTLTSVAESPFTSVNASDTVATTSFAGFASAGTTITMTPHIAEGDHLQLEYSIDLSSFTGEGSATVPPPRQTNAITSNVTIPDGSTIIVGGLNRVDESDSRSTVPLVGDIPLLGKLIGQTSHSKAQSTLFVFIRPIILRDDQFLDLKHYSKHHRSLAGLPDDLPSSKPLLMD